MGCTEITLFSQPTLTQPEVRGSSFSEFQHSIILQLLLFHEKSNSLYITTFCTKFRNIMLVDPFVNNNYADHLAKYVSQNSSYITLRDGALFSSAEITE